MAHVGEATRGSTARHRHVHFMLWLLLLLLAGAPVPTAQQEAGGIAAQMGGDWKDVPYKVHTKLHDDCLQGNVTAVCLPPLAPPASNLCL